MNLSNDDRSFLMDYLGTLKSLQDCGVRVNKEINDVVATIHGSLNLENKKNKKEKVYKSLYPRYTLVLKKSNGEEIDKVSSWSPFDESSIESWMKDNDAQEAYIQETLWNRNI